MSTEIILIVAMSENRVIGKDGKLPWSLKEDMLHFKTLTTGFPCVMGRKTYESIPNHPLPNRENLVISSTFTDNSPGVKVFTTINSALDYCKDYGKVFICGGGSIYKEAINFANKIELTLVHGNYEGDTYFPEIDWGRRGTYPAPWGEKRVCTPECNFSGTTTYPAACGGVVDKNQWVETGVIKHDGFSFVTLVRK